MEPVEALFCVQQRGRGSHVHLQYQFILVEKEMCIHLAMLLTVRLKAGAAGIKGSNG